MKFLWRSRETGVYSAKVNVTHRLTIPDVALILVLDDPANDPDVEHMTLAEIGRSVRSFLYWRGRDVLWTFADNDHFNDIEGRAEELIPDLCERFGVPEHLAREHVAPL